MSASYTDMYCTLTEFHKRVAGEDYSDEMVKPYLPFIYSYNVWSEYYKDDKYGKIPALFYLAEYMALLRAVNIWLVPPSKDDQAKRSPMDRFASDDNYSISIDFNDTLQHVLAVEKGQILSIPGAVTEDPNTFLNPQYTYDLFYNRTGQVSVGKRLVDSEGEFIPIDLYSSANLISLAWIEILHALNHALYARTCANCGKVYYVQRPYTAMTCSLRCYFRKYRAEYPGGEQAFKNRRAAERREKRHNA